VTIPLSAARAERELNLRVSTGTLSASDNSTHAKLAG
jgi:hypothetical protein